MKPFRRAAKQAHPDLGGTAAMFRKLVEARDRLLSALGTSAPAPTAAVRAGRDRGQMRGIERRLAKLEAAMMGPARQHVISIGCDCDEADIAVEDFARFLRDCGGFAIL